MNEGKHANELLDDLGTFIARFLVFCVVLVAVALTGLILVVMFPPALVVECINTKSVREGWRRTVEVFTPARWRRR